LVLLVQVEADIGLLVEAVVEFIMEHQLLKVEVLVVLMLVLEMVVVVEVLRVVMDLMP
jgi:hypothetical protein